MKTKKELHNEIKEVRENLKDNERLVISLFLDEILVISCQNYDEVSRVLYNLLEFEPIGDINTLLLSYDVDTKLSLKSNRVKIEYTISLIINK